MNEMDLVVVAIVGAVGKSPVVHDGVTGQSIASGIEFHLTPGRICT